jgi:predicted 2-oxoglutarate/Fe(II)-dependent dioxygenase YbiX
MPYRVMSNFLGEDSVDALLRLALTREADFQPTRIGWPETAQVRPDFRISSALKPGDALKPLFASRLRELAPRLTADMRLTGFKVSAVELELVAHGDGAFYKRHIDTRTSGDSQSQRILSGVYYFNRQPKRFSGGALRLYAIGDTDRFIDIEPVHNSLVVFPSWAPHEVMPVHCPSGAFVDSRFAVNCWLWRTTPVKRAASLSGDDLTLSSQPQPNQSGEA